MHDSENTLLHPYLTFAGNCMQAMEFYKVVLKGNLQVLPFEGNPIDVPEDYKQKVMHSTLTFGKGVLMASDNMPGQEVTYGNGHYLSLSFPKLDEASRVYTELSEGGHQIMPFEKTFWGAEFGMITDKFGIGWMIGYEGEKSDQD